MSKTKTVMLSLLFLLVAALAAEPPSVCIVSPLTTPLKIDGLLDDPAWQQTIVFSDFKTYQPDYGLAPSERTEVHMAYDSSTLYFAVHCFDSEPGKIKATMAKRDGIDSDDWVGVGLDTFGDKQSGYLFGVNPLGIQMDGTVNQDGNGDSSFDMVWSSKGRITADGYEVAMAIPWKCLRFPAKKNLTMGLIIVRVIGRKSEQLSFPPIRPDGGSLLSQTQRIQVTGIKYDRTVELLPALTYGGGGVHKDGGMVGERGQGDISLTGKLGITPELTLDATYNPDFSQVEADAGQIDINLRSALFYAEKRPFFLEGIDNFAFAGKMEASPLGAVVNTRTIVEPLLGFKLTGKVGSPNMLSGIFAIDEFPRHLAEEEGETGHNAAVSILRYKRILQRDNYIGGFYTGRESAGAHNRVFGSDGRFWLNRYSYLEYNAFYSSNRSADSAVSDPGLALNLRYAYNSRHCYLDIGYNDISKDFQTDSGYLSRTGVSMFPVFAQYVFYPKSKFFQRIEPFYWSTHARDKFSGLWETYNFFCLRFAMPRQSTLRLIGIIGNEVFADRRFNRSGWGIEGWGQIFKQVYLEAHFRHGGSIYYDETDPFAGRSNSWSVYLSFQPTEKLNSAFGVNFADFFRNNSGEKVYDYLILRNRTTFQLNKYLFFRGIIEYNNYWKRLNLDLLASFTYIPGTVIHAGYGSVYEKLQWRDHEYQPADDLLQTKKSFFLKASYLWRF